VSAAARILVTGGTGFVGRRLVADLLRDGASVRVLSRSAERARGLLPPDVEVLEGDLSDPRALSRAVAGRDVVHHLAVSRGRGDPRRLLWRVNVEGTRFLLEAARAEGVRRFVHVSTCGVLGHVADPPADETRPHRPGYDYQATKSEAEIIALGFHERGDLPVTIARPSSIYGPGDFKLRKLFRAVARRRFVMVGSGRVFTHHVHVEDVVRGLRLLERRPEAPGEVFILADERYRPLNELVALVADIVGVPRPRLRLPALPFRVGAAILEDVCLPLGIQPPIHRRSVYMFTKSRAFSIEKARRRLGYQPQVELEAGLRELAAWHRAAGHLS
jgi:nucleoside-diphosphate-sugar epimerase